TALTVKVTDQGGNPVSGVGVTFQAPSTGASGTFSTGATATASTNASGVATAPTFTANSTVGGFSLQAFVTATPSVTTNFSLTNMTGTPSSMAVNSGSGQGVKAGQQFGSPLSVIVKDIGGNPVSGVTVTFTSPASPNPGATFVSGSVTTT